MIAAADGPLKDRLGRARLRLDGRQERPRRSRSRRRSRWTARSGSGARRAASWSATSGKLFGGVEAFEDADARRRRSSRSASSPPTAPWRGCGRSPAPRSTRPRRRRTRETTDGAQDPDPARPQGALRARRRRPLEGEGRCGSRSSPARPRLACPARPSQSPPDSSQLVQLGERPGRPPPPPPLRRIVTAAARSSSSSTAIELSKVGPRSDAPGRAGGGATPAARASQARDALGGRRVAATLISAPLARRRAGCGTASRRPGRRGSPGRAPSSTSAT